MKPQFVETIPNILEQDAIYISLKYSIAIHLCACGCGKETVTPLGENDWRLTIENELVSLTPSIGNFQFPCKSHYFLTKNEIVWC